MGERAPDRRFVLCGRSRMQDAPGHWSPQALEAALYQRRTHATQPCFIRTRRLRASIPAYPDYRTAFTFIHANTAHIYPYFFVMHFVFRNKRERFQGIRTDVIEIARTFS